MDIAKKVLKLVKNVFLFIFGFIFVILALVSFSDKEMIAPAIICSVIAVICFWSGRDLILDSVKRKEGKRKERNELLSQLEQRGFKEINSGIWLNEMQKLIRIDNNEIAFDKIIEANIIEDCTNKIVNSSVNFGNGNARIRNNGKIRGSNIGTTLGNSTEQIIVDNLSVDIKIDSISEPFIRKIFAKGLYKSSSKYQIQYEKAQKLLGTLNYIIDKNRNDK